MRIDLMEAGDSNLEYLNQKEHLKTLHNCFKPSIQPVDGYYQNFEKSVLEMGGKFDGKALQNFNASTMESVDRMFNGIENSMGKKTLGLKEISTYKLDPNSKYYNQNLKQQAGYAAEVLSTEKANIQAKAEGSGIKTYRYDDLQGVKNDPFVDKVRVNEEGEIIDRIQTKFVGKNGKDWVQKMMSPKFEKYLDTEKVTKLECPKDYYDEAKSVIPKELKRLEQQLERVTAAGKVDVAEDINHRIQKLKRIDEMMEQSNTTTNEAVFARLHSKAACAKLLIPGVGKLSNIEGIRSGTFAAGITFISSTVDNVSQYMDGKITPEDMVKDVMKDTVSSGVIGYGTAFVETTVSQTMKNSSHALVKTLGKSCLPAALVSFGVESYDSMSDFATGKISGKDLAYDLGENAVATLGSSAGAIAGAKLGGMIGTTAGPVGTVAGAIVGGVVGCAMSTEVYETAIEVGAEGAEQIADKAKEFADSTIDVVAQNMPEQLEDVKIAFNDFISSTNLPFHV